MKENISNKLITKWPPQEETDFIRSIRVLQKAYTQGEQQMSKNIINYCTGTMSSFEKQLFEFKLKTDTPLRIRLEAYLNNAQ